MCIQVWCYFGPINVFLDFPILYRILAEQGEEGAVAAAEFADIEKIRKQVRGHRCTYDTYDQDKKTTSLL